MSELIFRTRRMLFKLQENSKVPRVYLRGNAFGSDVEQDKTCAFCISDLPPTIDGIFDVYVALSRSCRCKFTLPKMLEDNRGHHYCTAAEPSSSHKL